MRNIKIYIHNMIYKRFYLLIEGIIYNVIKINIINNTSIIRFLFR